MAMAEWNDLLAWLVAVFALWRWWRWKATARRREQDVAVFREALQAIAFETTNAVNAIRAHLHDFRQLNPSPVTPEHLDQIGDGANRIARVVRIADDPHSWYQEHRAKRPAGTPATTTEFAAPMVGEREVQ